jgi:hypothetical protein
MDHGRIFVNFDSEKMWKKVDRIYFKYYCKDIIRGVDCFWLFLIQLLDYTSSTALGYRTLNSDLKDVIHPFFISSKSEFVRSIHE